MARTGLRASAINISLVEFNRTFIFGQNRKFINNGNLASVCCKRCFCRPRDEADALLLRPHEHIYHRSQPRESRHARGSTTDVSALCRPRATIIHVRANVKVAGLRHSPPAEAPYKPRLVYSIILRPADQ